MRVAMPDNRSHSHHSRHGKKKDSHEPKDQPLYVLDVLWGCCNCGMHAGMSVFTDHCPECQQLRCDYCVLETVKHRTTGVVKAGEPNVYWGYLPATPSRLYYAGSAPLQNPKYRPILPDDDVNRRRS